MLTVNSRAVIYCVINSTYRALGIPGAAPGEGVNLYWFSEKVFYFF